MFTFVDVRIKKRQRFSTCWRTVGGGGGGRGGQTFFKQKRPLRLFTAATTFFQPVDWDEMSRWDHWREQQRNPWPHTSREAKKQQKKSHFWYLIRIDPVEHIKNFGRGQIHIFQTWTNLQVYKQNTVSQRWETQARGSPWIKLDWETPTWTWSKETRAWTFIIYLHLTERRGSKLIRQKKKLSLNDLRQKSSTTRGRPPWPQSTADAQFRHACVYPPGGVSWF